MTMKEKMVLILHCQLVSTGSCFGRRPGPEVEKKTRRVTSRRHIRLVNTENA